MSEGTPGGRLPTLFPGHPVTFPGREVQSPGTSPPVLHVAFFRFASIPAQVHKGRKKPALSCLHRDTRWGTHPDESK